MSAARAVSGIPGRVRWIAQDSSGAWRGYSIEPLRHDGGWYESGVGRCSLPGAGDPHDWMHSLRAVRFPPGVTAAVFLQDRMEIHYGEHLC